MLDEEVVRELRALEARAPGALDEVVHGYLESSAKLWGALGDAIQRADAPAVAEAAHRLKRASDRVGATALAAALQEIERLGRAGDVGGAADRVEAFGPMLDALRAALPEALAA